MSRIGKKPVQIPAGVTVEVKGGKVSVNGPKGKLEQEYRSNDISIEVKGGAVVVDRKGDRKSQRQLHGLYRALVQNMVNGASKGFERVLEISGVGYRAAKKGKDLVLDIGFCHQVTMTPPAGVDFDLDKPGTKITITGSDKQVVGQFAANVRAIRPPEPYNLKGIKYSGEIIQKKATKAFGAGA